MKVKERKKCKANTPKTTRVSQFTSKRAQNATLSCKLPLKSLHLKTLRTQSAEALGGQRGLTAEELQSVELVDDEELAAVLLEGQVAEPLEDLGHLQRAPVQENHRGASRRARQQLRAEQRRRRVNQPEEAGPHQDPGDVEQSHAGVDHVGVLDHPQQDHSEELTWGTNQAPKATTSTEDAIRRNLTSLGWRNVPSA